MTREEAFKKVVGSMDNYTKLGWKFHVEENKDFERFEVAVEKDGDGTTTTFEYGPVPNVPPTGRAVEVKVDGKTVLKYSTGKKDSHRMLKTVGYKEALENIDSCKCGRHQQWEEIPGQEETRDCTKCKFKFYVSDLSGIGKELVCNMIDCRPILPFYCSKFEAK